jgi:hypothetical protein
VDYRLRPDGLGDLFCTGFRAPDLHAILSRIAARSVPWGAQDDRTADQRRFDAVRDLLLGRDTLPPGGDQPAHCGAGCGCRAGQPVPCGAELVVHVPLGAALGVTDEVAELAGHGPLEPDLLATCCWPPHGCGRCGSGRTAPPSPSGTAQSGRNAGTRSPSATRCSTWPPCHRRACAPPPRRPPAAAGNLPGQHADQRPSPDTDTGTGTPHPHRHRWTPARSAGQLPAAALATPADHLPFPALRVARLRRARRPLRRRARPGLARRADLRLQPGPVLPPAPPGQATRLDQDPHHRRRPLDRHHRPQLAQPHPAPAARTRHPTAATRAHPRPVRRAQPHRARTRAVGPGPAPTRPRQRPAAPRPRTRRQRPARRTASCTPTPAGPSTSTTPTPGWTRSPTTGASEAEVADADDTRGDAIRLAAPPGG